MVTYQYTAQIVLNLTLPLSSAGILRNAADTTWKAQFNTAIANIDAAVTSAFGPNQPKTQFNYGYSENGQ